ncbi:hypothetical protein BJD99_04170 [Rhodococcus sp. 1163]|nr:hypothetical protein BJD99_04170 [Rhodococcus sp. 1163]
MDREFIVFTGPVTAAARFGWNITNWWFESKWPDLVYPANRSWLTYHDVDEDTVDIHGSAALIEGITALEGLTITPQS